MTPRPPIIDLGRLAYAPACDEQTRRLEAVIAAREAPPPHAPGVILFVEHDPVITVSRRPGSGAHLLASPDTLAREGVAVAPTDRGGDITYHGPGQLVAYPILDLNVLNLGLHDYMRLLEAAVIAACARFGVHAVREPGATGVWVPRDAVPADKICAMGVRVRRWVSMHGLALNVSTNLAHFGLIVPCGLVGRGVTSLQRELGANCPPMDRVKTVLGDELADRVAAAADRAAAKRATSSPGPSPAAP